MGLDKLDNTPVTVREFFPTTLCDRNDKGTLTVKDGCAVRFEGYKRDFLACARAVARLRDVLAVVPCFDILEENGTAYSISEYCEGMSLERYVRKNGPLSYEQARQLFLPLISAMSTIHLSGVLHLGISPKNVLMDEAGELRIKNFCIPETHTVNTVCEPVLIHGYAAPEQYEEGAVCTATADVYGLAATLFFALTGKTPPESTARTKKNEGLLMPAEVADSLPAHVKESLYRAMRISPNHRTQTAQQLWDELTATSAVAALLDNETEEEEEPAPQKSGGRGFVWLIFAGVLIALALLAGGVLYSMGYISFGGEQTTTTSRPDLTMPPTTTTTIVTKQTGTATVTVKELFGQDYYALKEGELDGKLTLSLMGYQFSDQPEGTILSQNPPANTKVERGAVIEVIISAGPKQKEMPDVAGWTEEHARLYLEALGFDVSEESMLLLGGTVYEKGFVEKTTPAAGEPIEIGETVSLWVSGKEAEEPAE